MLPWFAKGKFPLYLAPMAGITDRIFRSICKELGADVMVTEFVSSEGIIRRDDRTRKYTEFDDAQRPVGVQLFGADGQRMAEAAKKVIDWKQPDFIDLNFGCPVNKVVSKNGGSSLLKDCPLLVDTASRIVKAVGDQVPVTGKIRIGWDTQSIHLAVLGDLFHGRTVHSLAKLLANFDVALVYVAPAGLEMPAAVTDVVSRGTASQKSVDALAPVVADCDALYVTRVQRERFESQALYERTKGSYVVDAALMRTAKATCAILHPLPRVDEIATDVDALPNAAYFRQMEHGLYARMALLDLVLGRPSMLDGLRAALGL